MRLNSIKQKDTDSFLYLERYSIQVCIKHGQVRSKPIHLCHPTMIFYFIHKKAARLWTAHLRAVFSFWCYIGISIFIIWVTWSVLQILDNFCAKVWPTIFGITFGRRLCRYTIINKYQRVYYNEEVKWEENGVELIFGIFEMMIIFNGISILILLTCFCGHVLCCHFLSRSI